MCSQNLDAGNTIVLKNSIVLKIQLKIGKARRTLTLITYYYEVERIKLILNEI